MPSEILRVSIFLSYLGKFYVARNSLFSKATKKFSWTYTLEFWAEIFSQYSPLKVEHNEPSEFRSDAWFMRKKIVSILKKPHCTFRSAICGAISVRYQLSLSSTCSSNKLVPHYGPLNMVVLCRYFFLVFSFAAKFATKKKEPFSFAFT